MTVVDLCRAGDQSDHHAPGEPRSPPVSPPPSGYLTSPA